MIHYSFIGYMLAAAVVMIVGVMAYRVLMEDKVRPSTNRWILLSIYVLTFLLPLLMAIIPETYKDARIEIGNIEFGGETGTINSKSEGITLNISDVLYWVSIIYLAGLFITLFYSIMTFGYLIFILAGSKKMEIGGVEVYIHDNKKLSSFSWGNKIFLYEKTLNSGFKDLQMLVAHEQVHLHERHWIDLVLAQLVLIFQWFNPAARFMRRELQRIHEYEADEAVLQTGIDEKEYQILLIQNISGNRYSGLTDGLNNCSLKKRIIMMKKTKFKKDSVIRGIAVCGFAILGGLIIHIPGVAAVLSSPSNAHPTVQNPYENDSYPPAETQEEDYEKYKEGEVYRAVEFMPMYAGSSDPNVLLNDLYKTLSYPKNAEKSKIEGTVVVRFTVFKDGKVGDYKIVRPVNPELDEEALKAIKTLPQQWTPGYIGKKAVDCYFNLPVSFKLKATD